MTSILLEAHALTKHDDEASVAKFRTLDDKMRTLILPIIERYNDGLITTIELWSEMDLALSVKSTEPIVPSDDDPMGDWHGKNE